MAEVAQDLQAVIMIQRIASTNNHASLLIDQGLYDHAMIELARTLTMCTATHGEGETNSNSALKECLDYSKSQACCLGATVSSSLTENSSQTSLFVSKQSIKIPQHLFVAARTDTEDTTTTSELSLTDLSFIVMFNLSLTYQLKGSVEVDSTVGQEGDGEDVSYKNGMLLKALKIYKLCYLLLCSGTCVNDGTGVVALLPTSSLAVAMVLFNNMGIIHHQLSQRTAAAACFEAMLSLIMVVVDYCQTRREIDGGDMNGGVVFNPSMLIPQLESLLHNAVGVAWTFGISDCSNTDQTQNVSLYAKTSAAAA